MKADKSNLRGYSSSRFDVNDEFLCRRIRVGSNGALDALFLFHRQTPSGDHLLIQVRVLQNGVLATLADCGIQIRPEGLFA